MLFNMKMTIVSIVVILSVVICSCTTNSLSGTYVNYNFYYTPFVAEIPYVEDTLILKNNLKFTSGYFGEGEYEIISSDNGKSIILNYNYEMGKASFEATVEEDELGKVKIILFKDQNHYYKKID